MQDYFFEFDVAAPIELVFDTLADPRTYPKWWTQSIASASGEGTPGVGFTCQVGCVDWRVNGVQWDQRMEIVRYERPHVVAFVVDTSQIHTTSTWIVEQRGDRVHIRREIHPRQAGIFARIMGAVIPDALKSISDVFMNEAKLRLQPYLDSLKK